MDLATQFTDFYYRTFDTDRSQLAALYRPTSMLTFNGTQVSGRDAISEKFANLPFRSLEHVLTNVNAQPSIHPGALIVSVAGFLKVDGGDNPLSFSQAFQLVPEGGTYYVHNDIFCINVG